MKALIQHGKRLAFVLFLTAAFACSSVDKLVETGQYDKAIEKTVDKLAGKKNKKHELVTALEEAFRKATERDMRLVNQLIVEDNSLAWDKIYELARRIERRQEAVRPLLPLIDKEGYKANFSFVDVNPIIQDARDGAASAYYAEAQAKMEKARNGDRVAAREAYELLNKIDRYYSEYRNKEELKEAAYKLGQTRIAFSVTNKSNEIMPEWLSRELTAQDYPQMQSRWRKIIGTKEAGEYEDYQAVLSIESIHLSPESWKETIEHISRDVEEREYLRDKDGKFVVDSSGKKIEVVQEYTVHAKVTEILQQKSAQIQSLLEVRDSRNGKLVWSQPFTGTFTFENRAVSYEGDKRALGRYADHIGHPLPFPPDADMLIEAARQLKANVMEEILDDRRII